MGFLKSFPSTYILFCVSVRRLDCENTNPEIQRKFIILIILKNMITLVIVIILAILMIKIIKVLIITLIVFKNSLGT